MDNEAIYTLVLWTAFVTVMLAGLGIVKLFFMARRVINKADKFITYVAQNEEETSKYK